jgi:hypothetical protein
LYKKQSGIICPFGGGKAMVRNMCFVDAKKTQLKVISESGKEKDKRRG